MPEDNPPWNNPRLDRIAAIAPCVAAQPRIAGAADRQLEAAIAVEDRNQILCSQTVDAREGMAAFAERRVPNYRDA